jgi:hypothetical protein
MDTALFPAGRVTARRFTGIDTSCASCHVDPHRAQLGSSCQACHSTDTFVVTKFVHKNEASLRSFFTGRHTSASCVSCHKPLAAAPPGARAVANYAVTTACTSCHVDVHRGALGSACATCHKP